MKKLEFTGGKKAINNLVKVQDEIDHFLKKHPGKLNDKEHAKLGKLLNKRAKALSAATGMKVRSIFE